MKVTICISTLKRANYLRTLLLSINTQELLLPCVVAVNVVDNDPERSSEPLIKEIAGQLNYIVKYDCEIKHGIPFSRNKAVHMADPDTDYIVFVDDDEFADTHWLQNLLLAKEKYGADLISGAVKAKFVTPPPKWVIKGRFFVKRFYKKTRTGDSRPYASTNNLLVTYSKLMQLEGPFNEKMALTGGSDIEMTMRLKNMGCKIIWTHDAFLWEWVPKERANLRWILQRALRVSSSNWFFEEKKNLFVAVKTFLSGLGRILFGLILILPAVVLAPFTGLQYVVHLIRVIVRGVGIIAGMFGYWHEEYKYFYTESDNN
jgi:succinoglycan biosynthesis protein ExoM